jgi:hypothetical protein
MRIVITAANRCPQGILWAPHFRADGSCHCERRHDEEALTGEFRRIDRQGRALARQARALLRRLGKR